MAVEIGLCNSTDMVAERGPISTAGSSSPGGEQVTLQMIWEKLCCLEEVVRGKAFHEEVRAGEQVSGANRRSRNLRRRMRRMRRKILGRQPVKTLQGP